MNNLPLRIVFFDVETGGLTSDCSLFELAVALWEDSKIVDTFDVKIKNDKYVVTKDALKINKIDIVEHDSKSITKEEASEDFFTWLSNHFYDEIFNQRGFITIGAHNINFDLQWFKPFYNLFAPEDKQFSKVFSYRYIDSSAVIRALAHAGLLPPDMGNLKHVCDYLNIELPENLEHTALGDVIATANLYTKLLELIKRGKINEN